MNLLSRHSPMHSMRRFILLIAFAIASFLPSPDAKAQNDGTVNLLPEADAYVDEALPTTNRGYEPFLFVGPAPHFGYRQRAFLEFDVSDLPADATVERAVLRLYQHTSSGDPSPDIKVGASALSWGENDVVWSNQPIPDRHVTQDLDVGATDEAYADFDVTTLVRGWRNGSIRNRGLVIWAGDERAEQQFARGFYSREASRCQPHLIISYTTDEVAPAPDPAPGCEPRSDTTAPEITFTILPASPSAGDLARVIAAARDDNAIGRVQLTHDGALVDDQPNLFGTQLLHAYHEVQLAPGVYTYTALAWDEQMNTSSRAYQFRIAHEGEAPTVGVSHTPAEPDIGEPVTFRVEAHDPSGLDRVELTTNWITQTETAGGETGYVAEFVFDAEALGFDPSGVRIIRYTASAVDPQDHTATTETRYVLLGNDAPDADADGLADEIEDLMGLDPRDNDTDGDGLYDGWEVLGVDRNGDGTIDVDLPGLGAHPHHKDIFVEVDWMAGWELEDDAAQALVNTFRDYSYRLHLDRGNLGGGNSIPYAQIGCGDSGGVESDWIAGTKRDNHDPNRLGIFRYAMFLANDFNTNCGSKTVAGQVLIRQRGNVFSQQVDLMHELGHALGLGHGGQRELARPESYLILGPDGTFVTVDGKDWEADPEHYKPNYLSIMNYQYQWELRLCVSNPAGSPPCQCVRHLDRDAPLAVSEDRPICNDTRVAHYNLLDSVLNEQELSETDGLYAPAELGTYVWRRATDTWELLDVTQRGLFYLQHYAERDDCENVRPKDDEILALGDGLPIDWNFNGTTDEGSVEFDLNQYYRGDPPTGDCHNERTRRLRAPFELPLLRAKPWGRQVTHGFPDESGSPEHRPAAVMPTDVEAADRLDNDGDGLVDEGFPDIDADGTADLIDNCPRIANADQFDTDRNYRGDACEHLPEPPSKLALEIDSAGLVLGWAPSSGENVIGYNVYEKGEAEPAFRRLGVSYPTTLEEHGFRNPRCEGSALYALTAVDIYMRESLLSEGILLGDADGDGACDHVRGLRPDPYEPAPGCPPEETWDRDAHKCVPAEMPDEPAPGSCPEGTRFDTNAGECVIGEVSEEPGPETCPPGTFWDDARTECVTEAETTPPLVCLDGQVVGEECVCAGGRVVTPEAGAVNTFRCACASGEVWDQGAQNCAPEITCQFGTVQDNQCLCTGGRIPKETPNQANAFFCGCPEGQRWDGAGRRCVARAPEITCQFGTVENGICTCTGGRIAKKLSDLANAFFCGCPDGQRWDGGQRRCVSRSAEITCRWGSVVGGRCTCTGGRIAKETPGRTNAYFCGCPDGQRWNGGRRRCVAK